MKYEVESLGRKIGNDALKLSIAQIITLALSLGSTMLLSRFRTLEEYGTYSQLLMVTSLLLSIVMLGIPNCLNYFMARAETHEDKRHFLSQYYSSITVLSILAGGNLALGEPLVEHYFNNSIIRNYIFVLALYPWASAIMGTVDYLLVFYKKTVLLTKYKIGNRMALLGIILLTQIFHLSFYSYMVLFLLVQTIFACIVYLMVKDICGGIRLVWDKSLLKKMLHFSVPLGLSAIIGTINIELDKLLIGRFYTTEEMAVYTNAAKEMPVTIIASAITTVLLPMLVIYIKDKKYKQAVAAWSQATIISYAFICFFSFALVVFAPEVITVLYSEKYLSGTSVFRIYSILILLRCTHFGMVLNALGETKSIMKFSLLSIVFNVVLNILFYYTIGFNGPAVATLVATVLLATTQLITTSRKMQVPFMNIFPWKELGKVTMLNLILAVGFYSTKSLEIVKQGLENDIVSAIILGIIWLLLYVFIIQKYIRMQWSLLNAH